MADVRIASSALRHGITREDIVHAFRHRFREFDLDDDITMAVGPSTTAQLLEVGFVGSSSGITIIHSMPARSKWLR